MHFFAFGLLLYFLPSIIGHQKRSFGGIFVLNLLLGWTVIGWVAALIWACTDEVRGPVFAVNGPSAYGPSRYCCRCGAAAPAGAQFCWACGARM
jgi:Superinfection immunity protein